MLSLLLSSLALAQPVPVVALGDGLVPVANTERAEASSNWVAVLSDCLEERSPGKFSVVDRTSHGVTASGALASVDELQKLVPGVVVVGVGAPEAVAQTPTVAAFRQDVDTLVSALLDTPTPRSVLLVGMVPGSTEASDPHRERAEALEAELLQVASAHDGVTHVGLWTTWPTTADARKSLALPTGGLSASGHARVAARVCDEVLKPAAAESASEPLQGP